MLSSKKQSLSTVILCEFCENLACVPDLIVTKTKELMLLNKS